MKNELEALLKEIEAAYEESGIKETAGLNYSLITGSLQKNQPLIIGFNWGASDTEYKPQNNIEVEDLCLENLGSMKRIIPFCKKYFGEDFLDKASQTNYCFFRSKSERDIVEKDLELCRPIFDKLIMLLMPSIVLCFSGQLREYLCNSNRVDHIEKRGFPFKRGSKDVTCYAARGFFNGAKIVFLPHPNFPIPGKTRNEAWDFIRASCKSRDNL